MEKTLVTLSCGCAFKTFDNCTCDETYCAFHQAERDVQKVAMENNRISHEAECQLAAIDGKKVRAVVDYILGVSSVTVDGISMTPKAYLELLEGKASSERSKIRK